MSKFPSPLDKANGVVIHWEYKEEFCPMNLVSKSWAPGFGTLQVEQPLGALHR